MAGSEDAPDVFFLPFESSPVCSLEGSAQAPSGTDKSLSLSFFASVRIKFAQESTDGEQEYVLHQGDFAMLRPPCNDNVPFIGRIVTFLRNPAKTKETDFVRVQWFYHACDYLEKLPRAPAEDELLETPHFSDVEVSSIVGRCTVSSYENYARLTLLPTNITAAPELGEVDEIREDPSQPAYNAGDDGSDRSDFGDNYANASTRYFCREFYDACLDRTAIAEFDDPDADPVGDMHDERRRDHHDPDALVASESDESSEEMSEYGEDGDAPKRRRKSGSGKTQKRRKSTMNARSLPDAIQFSLPSIEIDEVLPCREAEKEAVLAFLNAAIEVSGKSKGSGRCMYISGVPGTGKTATVREVISGLRKCHAEGAVASFEVIEVNGMGLADPNLIYSELYAAVVGKRGVVPSRAQQLLGERFASNDERKSRGVSAANVRQQGKCVILVLDEMDILVSRSQQLLHTVLEWAARPNSRLAVIGIANTMDLPERLLSKSKSRMGDNRLVYAPYNKDQLMEILDLRLRDFPLAFDKNAQVLVASKIASLSGDVRRALELCRRSVTLAQSEKKMVKSVSISHVNDAVGDITRGARLKMVASAPLNDRLVLVATLVLSRSLGSFDSEACASLRAIFQKCLDISKAHKKLFTWGELAFEELESAVSRLAAQRLLLVERDARPLASRVVVNMSPDDVIYALDEDPLAKAELQHKQR